jgi:hypothetical protein
LIAACISAGVVALLLEVPAVPERVAQPGDAGAEDLLDDVPIDRRACIAGLLHCGIEILHVQHQTNRRTRLGGGLPPLVRKLVGQVPAATTQPKLGVADLAIGHGQPVILHRPSQEM